MKHNLLKHQKEGVNWLLGRMVGGLFFSPGLGKTLTVLTTIDILKKAKDIDRVLVIAPLRVCYMVWPREVEKWGFNFSVGILHGPNKDTVVRQKHDIYVINPEGLSWLSRRIGLFKTGKFMLVCDESTLFKNHSSMRFKTLKNMLECFRRRVILTGTPAPNGLTQLWPQMYILDRGARLGKNITTFRKKWFTQSFTGYGYDIINGADEAIYAAINDIVMHKGHDELELPEKFVNYIYVKLPLNAVKAYNDMKNTFVAFEDLEDDQITAFNAAAKASNLKQIANGMVYSDNKMPIAVHNEKLCALEELMESLSTPLLIVYEFNHDRDRLIDAFGFPYIGGGISGQELNSIIDKWNKGKIKGLLIQPMAGGHGLNLQDGGCRDIVFYSMPFDLELYDQVIARVHRQGVKESVTVHHIVAGGTVDEKIISVLEGKSTIQQALLEALKR